jgi:hypothetical protein
MKQLISPMGMNSEFTEKKHSRLNGVNLEHYVVNYRFESHSDLDKIQI